MTRIEGKAPAAAAEAVPVEIIRLRRAAKAAPRPAAETQAPAAPEVRPDRSRAAAVAGWLGRGADPEARAEALGRPAPSAPAAKKRPPAPIETPHAPEAPIALEAAARAALATETERLALRIALFGGEISEQRYGPERRWALLDREGAALETPEAALVRRLIEAGRLRLSRFEAGAAIWRLSDGAPAPMVRAAYRQGPAETL